MEFLFSAIIEKNVEKVDRLASRVKDIHEIFEDRVPLQIASSIGNVEVGMVLVSHGAKWNVYGESQGSPLHCAARENNIMFCKFLLDIGHGVDVSNQYGNTALGVCAAKNFVDLGMYLAKHGANVMHVNNRQMTILDIALTSKNLEFVEAFEKLSF